MGILLLAAFILVPLVEIAVFIQVGGLIGLWPTLGLIVLTAVLGSWQLRAQGLATLGRARAQMERGVMPARELFDGLCLLLAGALLLTPGFVTDAAGALLFVPGVRDLLRRTIGRHLAQHAETRVHMHERKVYRGKDTDGVIDGEFEDVTKQDDDEEEPPRRLPR
ncbi:MAG: FxsA family protein [Rhodospirillales bacterium]|nr:FxsA family protein [Rhodospirillales bacterium]